MPGCTVQGLYSAGMVLVHKAKEVSGGVLLGLGLGLVLTTYLFWRSGTTGVRVKVLVSSSVAFLHALRHV